MRVALVVPETTLNLAMNTPPFNLGYLASYLRKQIPNIQIKIFDGLTHRNIYTELFKFQPNIVGITATTPQVPAAYALADWLKRNRPNVFVVMGGVHVSVLPQEAIAHVDCVVIGEGETAFVDIVNKFTRKEPIEPIITGFPIDDLDNIPMPAYDLMDMKSYLMMNPTIFPLLPSPVFGILTSRGCPYRCSFCYNSFRTTKPRWFSAKRIIEEISYLITNYGARNIFFNDDEFLVNNKRLKELAQLFGETGLNKKIVWGCQARVESINSETIRLVKKMGCVLISSGFENGTQRILSFLKQGVTVERNKRAIQIGDVDGLHYGGGFVFGSPSETLQEMKQTAKWFEDNDVKWIGINTLIPYPGTEVWKLCKAKGLLPEKVDYSRLIPTARPQDTYVIDYAVSLKAYSFFMKDIVRVAWLIQTTRMTPSLRKFFGMVWVPSWWWVLLLHPLKMAKILKRILKRRVQK